MQIRLTHIANKVVGTVGLPSDNTQGLGHHETVLQERRGKATEHTGLATARKRTVPSTVPTLTSAVQAGHGLQRPT